MHLVTVAFASVLIAIGLIGYLGTPAADDSGSSGTAGTKDSKDSTDNKEPAAIGKSSDSNKDSKSELQKPKTVAESKKASRTALIPALFGVVFLMFGTIGFKPEWRKHAMHGAVGLALLSCIAVGVRIGMKLGPWINNDPEVNGRAMIFQTLMFFACAIYLGLGVRSFVMARRARKQKAAKPA